MSKNYYVYGGPPMNVIGDTPFLNCKDTTFRSIMQRKTFIKNRNNCVPVTRNNNSFTKPHRN